MRQTLFLFAALAACSTAEAQVTRSGAGYLFRAKYTAGETIRLSSMNQVAGVPGVGNGMRVPVQITMAVQSVANGVATIRLTLGAVKLNNTVANPGQSVLVRLDNRNRPQGGGGGTAVSTVYPVRAVKVGQTWKASAPVSGGMGMEGTLNATYRFMGVKTVSGRGVAVMNYAVSGAASGSGTLMVLTKDGTLFSNKMQLKLNMQGQPPVSIVSTLTRS